MGPLINSVARRRKPCEDLRSGLWTEDEREGFSGRRSSICKGPGGEQSLMHSLGELQVVEGDWSAKQKY